MTYPSRRRPYETTRMVSPGQGSICDKTGFHCSIRISKPCPPADNKTRLSLKLCEAARRVGTEPGVYGAVEISGCRKAEDVGSQAFKEGWSAGKRPRGKKKISS